ncbi:MAG: glycosyltransferase family 4 protein [Legionellaceae bacterium]|nr:glycosyltransferase family 4 protein [Legionellaceae bacterium]
MKVLVVNNMAPFIWGGAEELAVHLQKNLIIAGHQAEILRIPFQWEPAMNIPSQMLMARAFELWNVDQVIALKFPAYLIKHPKKTLWILHQYRQAYDLFDSGDSNIPANQEGNNLRDLIKTADNECFSESRRLFTNSEITQQRMQQYNGFNAEVLLPPVNDPERFFHAEKGDYIFAGGRINDMKRQYLLVEALAHADARVKLIIAGPPDSPADALKLKKIVCKFGLEHRVKLDLRFLPRDTYAEYINKAAAVAYLPFNEDSLGYVTMEAATASKALITTTDSGGVLKLVQHKKTGWVAKPHLKHLADVMSQVLQKKTKQYGEAAKDALDRLKINWPQTVETLLQ